MHAPLLTLVRSGEAHSHEVPIGEDAISSPHKPPRVRERRLGSYRLTDMTNGCCN